MQRAHAESILREISGPIVIDLSAASLAPSNAPFVAPGFTTREQVQDLSRFKLFHTPHPGALALATVIDALGDMPFCTATLMLGASSLGHGAISHLVEQSADLLNGKLELEDDERQAAFNVAPYPGAGELEKTLIAQVTRLTGITPQLVLQCVQIPVLHGGAMSLSLPNAAGAGAWAASLREAPGVLLVENEEPPTVVDAIEQEALLLSLPRERRNFDMVRVRQRPARGAGRVVDCGMPGAGCGGKAELNTAPPMRVRLTIEYDGPATADGNYRPATTLSRRVSRPLLERLFGQRLRIHGAGRTDAGVHALGQVAAFDAPRHFDPLDLRRALNALLPPDIAVRETAEAAPGFDARRDARLRVYEYASATMRLRSAFDYRYAWHIAHPLNFAAMRAAPDSSLANMTSRLFAPWDADQKHRAGNLFKSMGAPRRPSALPH